METNSRHYKFINSKTGNSLYYYTLDASVTGEKARQQLDLIRAEVAVANGVFLETIYWEEIKEEK